MASFQEGEDLIFKNVEDTSYNFDPAEELQAEPTGPAEELPTRKRPREKNVEDALGPNTSQNDDTSYQFGPAGKCPRPNTCTEETKRVWISSEILRTMTKEDVEARAARVVAESGPLSAAEEKEIKTQLTYLYSHSKCNLLRKISNRISARKSRMQTISYIECLQMKVAELTEQNTALRMRVQQLEHPQHFSRSPVALAIVMLCFGVFLVSWRPSLSKSSSTVLHQAPQAFHGENNDFNEMISTESDSFALAVTPASYTSTLNFESSKKNRPSSLKEGLAGKIRGDASVDSFPYNPNPEENANFVLYFDEICCFENEICVCWCVSTSLEECSQFKEASCIECHI